MNDISAVRQVLLDRLATLEVPRDILKADEIKQLYAQIPALPSDERRSYGQSVNELKNELEAEVLKLETSAESEAVEPIDITAPFDVNVSAGKRPKLLPTETGSVHPLMAELETVIDIFTRMGFTAIESKQLDSDFNMFGALNFPDNHPARDAYDTFHTEEGFIPPAHTSTMQNRIMKDGKHALENEGKPIATISYGRVFRNEDVDATHEHTFYQVEGVYVSDKATLSDMIGTLKAFFETYYKQELRIKTQPAYFPFVEPGLEFVIERPQALGSPSSGSDWLEMLGCGMIHPNVLEAAGIDPQKYRGFAWGGGLERLVMLKYAIEDLRHFESAKLKFLRKFV